MPMTARVVDEQVDRAELGTRRGRRPRRRPPRRLRRLEQAVAPLSSCNFCNCPTERAAAVTANPARRELGRDHPADALAHAASPGQRGSLRSSRARYRQGGTTNFREASRSYLSASHGRCLAPAVPGIKRHAGLGLRRVQAENSCAMLIGCTRASACRCTSRQSEPVAAEHQGHAQRPVLVGQSADNAVLPLHAHQHDKVARGVRLLELEVSLSGYRRRTSRAPRYPPAMGRAPCLVGPPVGGMSVKSGALLTSAK